MNTDTLITTLGIRYRDPTYKQVARTRWLDYLNESQRRFIKRARWPMTTFSTLAFSVGDASKALPADVWNVKEAYDTTNNRPLFPLPHRDQARAMFTPATPPGSSGYFYVADNDLFVLPRPRAAMNVQVEAWTAASDLVDSATASVIPAHYHHSLMEGALELAYLDDGDVENAERYGKLFADAVSDALEEFSFPRNGQHVRMRGDYFDTADRFMGQVRY